ncbi:MAG: NAD(P)-dependent oxidoreductase [Myxococcaceae bacterium]
MSRPKVLIAEPHDFSGAAKALLDASCDVELRDTDAAGLTQAFAGYDVVWVRLRQKITRELLAQKKACRVLACPVTGLDHIDLSACEQAGIKVVSLKGEAAFLERVRATAELTLGLALALVRHVPAATEHVREGHWNRDLFRGHELFEKTAGVLGVGRLGAIVARYYRALGMRVIGFDPRADFPADIERAASLEQLLTQSDLLSVHVSYSPATHHLLGAPQLAQLKPGAVLVNTARGGVVDEPALLEALKSGRLAGAALDVLSGEPGIDEKHPVVRYAREHRNCLVVPHIGGNTFESLDKTETFIAQKVLEALK